jgi:hypothetical protein
MIYLGPNYPKIGGAPLILVKKFKFFPTVIERIDLLVIEFIES